MGQIEKVLRILSINDSESDNREIIRHLEHQEYLVHCERVCTLKEFIHKLEHNSWNLVLSLSDISSFSPREALSWSKKLHPHLPFVLISNGIGEEEVANMMKAGAEDVVLHFSPHRLLQVARKVLREKEIKDQEAKANKMAHEAHAAREQMLAIVSHDIKNPLSAIQLEAQMLLKMAERYEQHPLSDDVKSQAGRILKTTERLKGLIVDLLDRNKTAEGLSSLKKSECDVIKLFQEVLDANRPLIKQKEIMVRTSFPDNQTELNLDKNKMFQVLNNLFSNAIKFTPVCGRIHLGLEENEEDFIFSVSDNGPGLKPCDLERVFEKYWTGGVFGCSGTGLGLFICKTIVEAHGGNISVENLSGGGSRFWFTLPKPFKNVQSWVKDQKRKILIIDDDDDLREVICWALDKEGFAVHSYADPEVALDSLRKGRHSPQLIVVDFHMDGMKGSEFLNHKGRIDIPEVKDCPVLMISASPDEVEAETSIHLYKEIITKPLDLEALVANIKSYVN